MSLHTEPYPAYRVTFDASAADRVVPPPPTVVPTDTWVGTDSQEAWDQLRPAIRAYLCHRYCGCRSTTRRCQIRMLGFSNQPNVLESLLPDRTRLFARFTPYAEGHQNRHHP